MAFENGGAGGRIQGRWFDYGRHDQAVRPPCSLAEMYLSWSRINRSSLSNCRRFR